MLKTVLVDGKIPYLPQLKKILYFLAWIVPFLIFILPREFKDFGEIGWYVLICVMAIRPLADVFPDLKLIRSLVMLRREFGVFSGMMILAHFVGFLILRDMSLLAIFTNSSYWDFNRFYFWGIVGVIVCVPILLTSNKKSMRLLKRHWKTVQKFSYLLFFFGAIHVSMAGEESGLFGLVLVAVFWVLAYFKLKIRLPFMKSTS